MTSVDNAATAEAERVALTAREEESAIVKKLLPRILSFRRYLTGKSQTDDPEAREVLEKARNVMVGYLAGYPDVRDQLIRRDLKRIAPSEVLRARPAEDEIDYQELIREHMERYPKIRAALRNEPRWLPAEVVTEINRAEVSETGRASLPPRFWAAR